MLVSVTWSWYASLRKPWMCPAPACAPTDPSRYSTFSVIDAESDDCPGAVARNVPLPTLSPWFAALGL